ncbi:MAG: Zn-ribbon domain-containing OB-fold protein [bacterium]
MESSAEPIRTVVEKWDITYRHDAGPVVSEFFRLLEEEGRITGRRCPECGRVLLPPRGFCDRCFVDTTERVEIGHKGIIETFTVVYQTFEGLPEAPYCIAYVRLEGADTAMLNYVRGVDLHDRQRSLERLRVGAAVRVTLAPREDRRGKVTDFWYELAD